MIHSGIQRASSAKSIAEALAPMETPIRISRLLKELSAQAFDGLLVTSPVNIRYLTGFSGSAGLLLVSAEHTVLTSDGRYGDQMREELEQAGTAGVIDEVVIGSIRDQQEAIIRAAAILSKVGLEASQVSWAQARLWKQMLSGSEVLPSDGVVERLRLIKDAGEIARIARAASIADEALSRVLPLLKSGATEREVAAALDHEMRLLGASASAFETIVAAGVDGAKPHARPGSRRIVPGEPVVIDFGAVMDGYRSDMTRTFCVGPPADPVVERMLQVVLESQQAGVQAVAPGVQARTVDATCRQIIAAAGWGEAFSHGTGHGVGLDIHEAPAVGATVADILDPGTVVTVEPGVYLAGIGGVRIEDTLEVTADGRRTLTEFPKDCLI